ncbi:hypothetical protein F4810DRAFT_722691 [Camillea tinctor]|nr:hypothetical protein F4810DRAFT_722691 [Camillea tinctor]
MARNLTYRLRGCPSNLGSEAIAQLLSRALGNIEASDIQICSLAATLDRFERPPTSIVTLMFTKPPDLIKTKNEWTLLVDGVKDPLTLDTHFLGWTPFNDPKVEQHEFDLIAISGLASHPFGSWQAKGEDKNYMWLRDSLPRSFPNTRVIIYGYDTTLHNSNSFQSIKDIAVTLARSLEACSWHLSSGKPLAFMAHSLGGIVLKETFILLAKHDDIGSNILKRIKGAIFFGVPSLGMANSHLYAMVKDQPNIGIVEDLSLESRYLHYLENKFRGLTSMWHVPIHWAYETKTSPTVTELEDGTFSRPGPEEILVTQASATRNSPYDQYESCPSSIFPINENHSNMVKFCRRDDNMKIVFSKLEEIYGPKHAQSHYRLQNTHELSHRVFPTPRAIADIDYGMGSDNPNHIKSDVQQWERQDLMNSLKVPGHDDRIESIDERFGHTFDWIFDENVQFKTWLDKEGTSVFWIHGKPGAGKSTLMKFIYCSKNFQEVLHRFASESLRISASFFFHDRGTALQKSFDGLLRSILYQIFEKSTELAELVIQDLASRYRTFRINEEFWTIAKLERCLRIILQQDSVKLDLFLLLDALDEYDGTPEFISGFLRDMIEVSSKSSNNLKILFSSRPWEDFKREFRTTQSIQLQDHTKEDIRHFCKGQINCKDAEIAGRLRPLISTIIDKADGVFLWVKLVLEELECEGRMGKGSEGLANILSSIPASLQEYYFRIIQRIPQKARFDGYIAFSLVMGSRDESPADFWELLAAMSCAHARTFQEALQNLEEIGSIVSLKSLRTAWKKILPAVFDHDVPSDFLLADELHTKLTDESQSDWVRRYRQKSFLPISDNKDLIEKQSQLMTSTGNLLELIPDPKMRDNILCAKPTLAHQTVREFIRNDNFETWFLGHDLGGARENVHTFLAKYHLTMCVLHRPKIYGMEFIKCNITTGTSLIEFIDSIPNGLFDGSFYEGPIDYALKENLKLFLMEKLQRCPDLFRDTKEKLLSRHNNFLLALREDYLEMLKFSLDSGYSISQDPDAFKKTIDTIVCDYDFMLNKGHSDYITLSWLEKNPFLEGKATFLLQHVPNLSIVVPDPNIGRGIYAAKTPKLIYELLNHGANINETDKNGSTPLDHMLTLLVDIAALPQPPDFEFDWLYMGLKAIIENGGIPKTTLKSSGELVARFLEAKWDDTTMMKECLSYCVDSIEEEKSSIVDRLKKTMHSLGS